jgi:hypothetical protein
MNAIYDATGFVCCPYCKGGDKLRYTVVPACERKYLIDDEEITEWWSESRDYVCTNCDFQFSTLMCPEDYE